MRGGGGGGGGVHHEREGCPLSASMHLLLVCVRDA